MPSTASTLKLFRQIHLYFGVFISPAILFFSITGALQTFSLHETTRGSDYKPPAFLVKLGQLHKKQTLIVPVRKPQPPAPAAGPAASGPSADAASPADPTTHNHGPKPVDVSSPSASSPTPQSQSPTPTAKPKNLLPMKLFFLLVAIGLVTSTVTGIYMAYKFNGSKPWITGLLLAGIIVPLLLLLF